MQQIRTRKAIACILLSVSLLAALFPVSAFAVTAAEKKAEVRSIQSQLSSLNDELDVAVDEYNRANRARDAALAEAEACQQRIDEAQSKINSLQTRISTRATSMYRTGSLTYLDVLLGAGSFDDFATMWDTLNNLNADDADLVASTKAAKKELNDAKVELDANLAEAQDQLAVAESYKNDIESKQARYQATYDSLSSEYQQLVAEEQASQDAAAAATATANIPSSSSGSSSRPYNPVGGSDAVSRAYSALGLPYVYGASSPTAFDCSGLVSWCLTGSFGHAYVSSDFWAMPAVSDPQPGDVVACHAGHCGLYIGDGMMIHAPQSGDVVKIAPIRGKIVRP